MLFVLRHCDFFFFNEILQQKSVMALGYTEVRAKKKERKKDLTVSSCQDAEPDGRKWGLSSAGRAGCKTSCVFLLK